MDAPVVPAEVESSLARLGFRATARLAPDRWLAVALDGTGHRIELYAMDADVRDDALVARVARLRGVRHEHLTRLLDATELAPGRVGLLVEHVDGLSLAQIRAARAPLSDGEAATVVVPVAGALGALHGASLAHGTVDATTILVRPDGRPVLSDLRGVVVGASAPHDDLRALVAAVVAQLPDDEVHLLAGGLVLRDALVDALGEPDLDAARLVDACFRATDPEPVQLPDAGSLASSALLSSARLSSARPSSARPSSARPASARRGPARATRHAARRRFPSRLVALACVAVLVSGVLAWRLVGSRDPVSALTDAHDPVAAAVELSRLRAAAVGDANPAGLGDVEVAGGPAHAADSALLATVDPARAAGLAVDVRRAWLVSDDGAGGSTTDVAVTAAMSNGSEVGAARTVVLGLRWTDEGWRVWDVTEPVG